MKDNYEKEVENYNKELEAFAKELVKETGFFKVPSKNDFKMFKQRGEKVMALPVHKSYIDNFDVEPFVEFFNNIEVTKSHFRQKVIFTISGYDEDMRELYEIKEVVNWVRKFMFECPQAIYYINNESSWSFLQACIAEKVTLIEQTGRAMSVKEVAYRQAHGLPVTKMKLDLSVGGHILENIISKTKRLGARINDLTYATILSQAFTQGFKLSDYE